MNSQISPGSSTEALELKRWTAAREGFRKLHADNADQWPSFRGMVSFVPKVFHRRLEIRHKDTRDMRAVLDYVLYLQNPDDTESATGRRHCKDPHKMKDVVKALREVVPAKSYADFTGGKEEVEDDDVAIVVLATRSYLLELTESKYGEDLTGTKTFAGMTFVNGDSSRSSEEPSHDAGDSRLIIPASTQDTTMALDPIDLTGPYSARSNGTTASELLNAYRIPLNPTGSPGRSTSVPIRETRNGRRSLRCKRTISEDSAQISKKARLDGMVEEGNRSEVRYPSIGRQARLPGAAASTPTPIDSIMTGIIEGTVQARKIVADLNEMSLKLNNTISTQDQEIARLTHIVQKLEMALACWEEVWDTVTGKNTRLEIESAVLRTLAKAKGVTEDELNDQLASINGM